jgi:hypothetical protein
MLALRLLEGAPGVREVALYGTAIHALITRPGSRPTGSGPGSRERG